MRCPRCYAYVEEGAYSCGTCGADLSSREPLADSSQQIRPQRSNAPRPRHRSEARPTSRDEREAKSGGSGCMIIGLVLLAAAVIFSIWMFDPFGFRATDDPAANNQNTNVTNTSQVKTPAIIKISQADSKEFPKMTLYLAVSSAGKPLESLDQKQLSISESASGYTYECTLESATMLKKEEIEKLEFPTSVSSAIYKVVYKTTFENKEAARTVLVSCAPDSEYTGTASLVYNPSQASKTEEEQKKQAEAAAATSSASTAAASSESSSSTSGSSYTPEPAPAPAPSGDSSYTLADSSSRLYSTAELNNMSLEDLSHARNEIYARHGYIFQRTSVLNYFNGKTWYNPTTPAASFSWDTLNDVEKANAKAILAVEQSRNSPYL